MGGDIENESGAPLRVEYGDEVGDEEWARGWEMRDEQGEGGIRQKRLGVWEDRLKEIAWEEWVEV